MARTIRSLLIKERRRPRDLHGHFEGEVSDVFHIMMSFPEEDHRFLNTLDNRADGDSWLSMLIGLFENSSRERLFTVVRFWSDETGKRRLLDVVDRWERCLKNQDQKGSEPE